MKKLFIILAILGLGALCIALLSPLFLSALPQGDLVELPQQTKLGLTQLVKVNDQLHVCWFAIPFQPADCVLLQQGFAAVYKDGEYIKIIYSDGRLTVKK